MTPAHTGEDRLAAVHRFTVLLFVALAAARLAYIAASGTPLHENFDHLLWAVPTLAIGTYFTFVRYHAIIAGLFNGLGLLGIGFTGSVLASVLTVYSGRHIPFADQALAAADQSLGFDWATWCTPVVRWIGLALNVLMLIATPIRGDHYLVDVLSGLAVAAAAVAATAWMLGRIPQGRQPALAAAASPI
jgi:hypothetical protein